MQKQWAIARQQSIHKRLRIARRVGAPGVPQRDWAPPRKVGVRAISQRVITKISVPFFIYQVTLPAIHRLAGKWSGRKSRSSGQFSHDWIARYFSVWIT